MASLPAISIVTPSFNRKRYLAKTMDSVLGQGYPRLEYVMVDGGSTDGSAELIERRAAELTWWVSEPDGGAWDAINKGFAHTSGEVMGWLGSDDLLMPWALSIVGEVFATFPQLEWLTTLFPTACDELGRPIKSFYRDAYSSEAFFRGENLPFAGWPAVGFIQQESTYWRRSLWDRAGGRLDESLELAADFELWARFHRSGAELYSVPVPLASFRVHGDQKSWNLEPYVEEARAVLLRYGGKPPTVRGVPSLRRALVRVLPRRVQRFGYNALAGLLGPPPTHGGLRIVHNDPEEGWRMEDP
jgi:glycosyltransferase involved in cell wall biosynthesis